MCEAVIAAAPTAGDLAGCSVGAALAMAVEQLAARPLDDVSAVLVMQSAQRLANHYQSLVSQLAVRIAGEEPAEMDFAREEVATALNVTPYTADRVITIGRQLARRFPDFAAAARAGSVSYQHCARLVEGCSPLSDADAGRAERLLLGAARTMPPGRFARKVAEIVIAVDPAGAMARHEAAVRFGTGMEHYPSGEGLLDIHLRMRADKGLGLVHDVSELAGRTGPDDARTSGERKVDALLSLVAAGKAATPPGPTGPAPRRTGAKRRAAVVLTAETLLALSEYPATLPGYGPIPAPLARELAGDARWQLFLVNARDRYLEGLSTDAYTPTSRIEDFLAGRDEVCGMPGCGQPAWRCESDHAVPYPHGPTDVGNLGPLCKRHHLLKHHGGWQLSRGRDGAAEWVSRLGLRYRKPPARYGSDDDLRDDADRHDDDRHDDGRHDDGRHDDGRHDHGSDGSETAAG